MFKHSGPPEGLLSSIRGHLLLLVAVCSFLPLGLMLYTALEARQSTVDLARDNLRTIARYAALSLERDINGTHQFLSALAHTPEVETRDYPACTRLFARLLNEYPRFANILLIEANGKVPCHGLSTDKQVNLSDREYVQRTLQEGRTTVGKPVLGRLSGRPVLPVSHPLKGEDGKVDALLSVPLDLGLLSESLIDADLPEALTFTLWDGDGRVMARHPDPEKWVGKWLPQAPIVQALRSRTSAGTLEAAGLDGVKRIWAVTPLPESRETGLWISAGIPTVALYAHADQVFVRNVVLLALVTLAALTAAWFLGERSIRRPAGTLVAAAHRLSAGDYAARIGPPYPTGELGELAHAFDTMAGSLQHSTREAEERSEEVHRLNADLERRVAERTAQLEITNRELESFSYSVSHDLRSPLRAIDGFALMLQEDYNDRLDDEGRRILQVIRDNASKMGRLIDDLLAFSRLGRKEMDAGSCDMRALVRAVFQEQQAEAGGRSMEFIVKPMPPSWCDRSLLRQVWANLLGNAIKFSSRQDRPIIEVGGHETEAENIYYVKDNGVGFDMRYYDKLFGVFQRLHSAEEFPGTGVGLAIVQRVVVRHGGRVWAESEPNGGATFYFSLPKGEAYARAATA